MFLKCGIPLVNTMTVWRRRRSEHREDWAASLKESLVKEGFAHRINNIVFISRIVEHPSFLELAKNICYNLFFPFFWRVHQPKLVAIKKEMFSSGDKDDRFIVVNTIGSEEEQKCSFASIVSFG